MRVEAKEEKYLTASRKTLDVVLGYRSRENPKVWFATNESRLETWRLREAGQIRQGMNAMHTTSPPARFSGYHPPPTKYRSRFQIRFSHSLLIGLPPRAQNTKPATNIQVPENLYLFLEDIDPWSHCCSHGDSMCGDMIGYVYTGIRIARLLLPFGGTGEIRTERSSIN